MAAVFPRQPNLQRLGHTLGDIDQGARDSGAQRSETA